MSELSGSHRSFRALSSSPWLPARFWLGSGSVPYPNDACERRKLVGLRGQRHALHAWGCHGLRTTAQMPARGQRLGLRPPVTETIPV